MSLLQVDVDRDFAALVAGLVEPPRPREEPLPPATAPATIAGTLATLATDTLVIW